jgi:hypothetical protein
MRGGQPASPNAWFAYSWLFTQRLAQSERKQLHTDVAARDGSFGIDGELGQVVKKSPDGLARITSELGDKGVDFFVRGLGNSFSFGRFRHCSRSILS